MNWGIIGLGNMAKNFATSIRNLDDTNLLAIASNSFFKLKKFGFRYGVKNKYQFKGYENIFSCKEIDNIYISTLNNTHFELILRCIKAKKNILCEKNPINIFRAFCLRTSTFDYIFMKIQGNP